MTRRAAFGGRTWQARIGLSLLLCVWVCACDVTGLPRGARRITPSAQYHAWWALTEACSGVQGDFNTVKWYILSGSDTFALEGETVNGAWYGGHDNWIVLGDEEEFDGSLVRHEMLHALLKTPGHPRQQFLGNCSDIVACIEDCVSDGGGPPDTSESAAILGPSVLPAAVLLAPDTVSLAADSGWTTITISITNTTHAPARVAVDTSFGIPESIILWHSTPGLLGVVEIQADYYFTLAPAGTAGATRRVVFDQQVPFTNTSPQYVITGLFGESPASAQTLTVAP